MSSNVCQQDTHKCVLLISVMDSFLEKTKKKHKDIHFIYIHSSLIDELANHNKLILTACKILIASFKNKTDDIQS